MDGEVILQVLVLGQRTPSDQFLCNNFISVNPVRATEKINKTSVKLIQYFIQLFRFYF